MHTYANKSFIYLTIVYLKSVIFYILYNLGYKYVRDYDITLIFKKLPGP